MGLIEWLRDLERVLLYVKYRLERGVRNLHDPGFSDSIIELLDICM